MTKQSELLGSLLSESLKLTLDKIFEESLPTWKTLSEKEKYQFLAMVGDNWILANDKLKNEK